VAQVAIGGLIFLVVLIIVHLITARISDSVLDSRVGAIDRILGLAFGMVRGFVLIVIPYMFAVSFVCKDNPARASAQGCRPGELPGWVENAQSLPLINQTSGTLFSLLSRYAPSVPLGTGEQRQGWLQLDHISPNALTSSNSG
jgi:membrane protein required for colicin V production